MAELNYVQMMRESLEKKIRILEEIRLLNREQNQILQDDNATPDQFDENIDKKQVLIDQLTGLDNGFQQMYNRVREALNSNRALYADEIRKMQMYIREITDLSATIQAQEKRNKQLAEVKFSNIKSKAKEVRKSQQAVKFLVAQLNIDAARGNVDDNDVAVLNLTDVTTIGGLWRDVTDREATGTSRETAVGNQSALLTHVHRLDI